LEEGLAAAKASEAAAVQHAIDESSAREAAQSALAIASARHLSSQAELESQIERLQAELESEAARLHSELAERTTEVARLFIALSREQQECQALQAEVLRGARLASAHTLELAALRGRLARRTIQMAALEEEVRDATSETHHRVPLISLFLIRWQLSGNYEPVIRWHPS
jgi:hypothetical protein